MSVPRYLPTARHRIPGRRAAEEATEKNSSHVVLPLIGPIRLPPPDQLAYAGGVAALVALEVIEWPIGLALCAGHVLATCSQNKILQDFGHALESA
ncbi:MAG: hypothetical protein JO037_16910 [Actinobacteria bacterium]|nr:hypothetical protein [Actinomycetota bacterium]